MPLIVLIMPKQALGGGRSGYGLVTSSVQIIIQCGYIGNMIFVTWVNRKDVES